MGTPFKMKGWSPFTKKKDKSSKQMEANIKAARDKNFTETNIALVKAGKNTMTRAEYDASLD